MQDDRLRSSLGFALVRAFRRVNRAHNRALVRHRLTAEQAHILVILWLDGAMKIGDLQRTLMLSSGTLTGALDRMEKSGLVRRVADPADRRAWRVEPVSIDSRRRRGIQSTLDETEAATFSRLTARERRTLWTLLERVGEA